MATSELTSALGSPPRRRKPITYGKQSRNYFNSFDVDTDSFDVDTDSLDKLELSPRSATSSVLTTPKKAVLAKKGVVQKADSGTGNFEVPSSDESDGGQRNAEPSPRPGTLKKVNRNKEIPKSRAFPVRTAQNPTEPSHPNKRRRVSPSDEIAPPIKADPVRQPPKPSKPHQIRSFSPACDGSQASGVKPKGTHPKAVNGERESKKTTARDAASKENLPPVRKIAQRARSTEVPTTKLVVAAPRKRPVQKTSTGKRSRDVSQLSTPPKDPTPPFSQSPPSLQRPKTPARQKKHEQIPGNDGNTLSTPVRSPSTNIEEEPAVPPVVTPKQERLWSNLLNGQDIIASPSRRLKQLRLDANNVAKDQVGEKDAVPRRRRIVDTLKASAPDVPSSDPVEEDMQEEDDIIMADTDEAVAARSSHDASGSQSQAKSAPSVAPVLHNKRTYGEQRSYLKLSGDPLEEILAEPLDDDFESPEVLRSQKDPHQSRTRGGKVDPFDMSDDDDGATGMRSMHELKAIAKGKTFAQDLESVLDDLRDDTDAGLPRRQRSLIELFKKLQTPAALGTFVRSGTDCLVLAALKHERDPIMLATAAAIVNLLLEDDNKATNVQQLYNTGISWVLTVAMDHEDGLDKAADSTLNNTTNLAQRSVTDLQKGLSLLSGLRSIRVRHFSPQLVALLALDRAIRRLRKSGNLTDPVLTPTMLDKLITILKSTPSKAKPGLKSHVLDTTKSELVLSILDAATLSPVCVQDRSIWTPVSMKKLLDSAHMVLTSDDVDGQARRLLALRLFVNLTNGDERNATFFSREAHLASLLDIINKGLTRLNQLEQNPKQLDLVLLSLGAMTNLAECSAACRDTIARQETLRVQEIVRAFAANREQAEEADSLKASKANVAFGYVAILLGHLCLSLALRSCIAAVLPGGRLNLLTQAVDEFITHHQKADKEVGNNASYTAFTERLETVADTLRSFKA